VDYGGVIGAGAFAWWLFTAGQHLRHLGAGCARRWALLDGL